MEDDKWCYVSKTEWMELIEAAFVKHRGFVERAMDHINRLNRMIEDAHRWEDNGFRVRYLYNEESGQITSYHELREIGFRTPKQDDIIQED